MLWLCSESRSKVVSLRPSTFESVTKFQRCCLTRTSSWFSSDYKNNQSFLYQQVSFEGDNLTNLVVLDVKFGLEIRIRWRGITEWYLAWYVQARSYGWNWIDERQNIQEGIMKNDETNKQEKKSAVALVTDDSSTTMKLLFNKVSSFSQILNCYGNSSK